MQCTNVDVMLHGYENTVDLQIITSAVEVWWQYCIQNNLICWVKIFVEQCECDGLVSEINQPCILNTFDSGYMRVLVTFLPFQIFIMARNLTACVFDIGFNKFNEKKYFNLKIIQVDSQKFKINKMKKKFEMNKN